MKHLVVSENNGVTTVALNRPEKHNAFNPEMISELTDLFLSFEKNPNRTAIILKGNGKSFSAGGDLEWMRSMVNFTLEENLNDARRLFDMYQAMAFCGTPLIGLVHGHVMGGGLGLVAVCDVVAAESTTQFCFSEAKIGIAPAVISPWVLRKVPQGMAREVMLTAKMFGVDHAKLMGLVHFSGPLTEAEDFVTSAVENLLKCSPGAVRAAKKLMNDISILPWSEMRDQASRVIAERRVSEEGQEGLKAFLEKREPKWRAKS